MRLCSAGKFLRNSSVVIKVCRQPYKGQFGQLQTVQKLTVGYRLRETDLGVWAARCGRRASIRLQPGRHGQPVVPPMDELPFPATGANPEAFCGRHWAQAKTDQKLERRPSEDRRHPSAATVKPSLPIGLRGLQPRRPVCNWEVQGMVCPLWRHPPGWQYGGAPALSQKNMHALD